MPNTSAAWNVDDASGNWSLNSNWSPANYPSGAGNTASFVRSITGTRTVTLDVAGLAIGNLSFSDGGASGDAWVLTRSSTNTLAINNSGSPAIVSVVTPTTISVPLTGTNAFTKSGDATLRTDTVHSLVGAISISAGTLQSGDFNVAGTTTNVFPSATSWNIAGSRYILHGSNVAYSISNAVSGAGLILLSQSNTATLAANGITFDDLSGFSGLMLLYQNGNVNNNRALIAVKKFPTSGGLFLFDAQGTASSSPVTTVTIPSDATAGSSTASFWLRFFGTNTATNWTAAVYANHSAGAFDFSGGIYRDDSGVNPNSPAIAPFTIGGNSTALNTISGLVREVTKQLSISKVDGGTWVFSAANTYTGGTALSGGTLRGSNSEAFGTGNITMSTSPVLELAGGISLTNGINSVGTIRSVSGINTVAAALATPLALVGTTTFEADAGATLVVSPASAITGTAAVVLGGAGTVTASQQFSQATTLTKNGAGTATVSSTTNAFASGATINDGVLAVPDLAALGTGTTLALAGGGVLRYTGSTGGTLSRTVSGTGLTGGFENTGSSNLAVGAGTIDGTIKLGSPSDGAGQYNTLAATVSSGGFTKQGPGRWISTAGNNLAGSTTVSAGTLMGANANGATSKLLGGAVTVAAGAKIQTGSDNGQQGKNRYSSLTFAGTPGTPARIRIGGSAVNPTVQIAGALTIPTGEMTWDISADTFKSKGVYTLVEFGPSGSLSGSLSNVTLTTPVGFESRTYGLAYNSGASPKTITVTIS